MGMQWSFPCIPTFTHGYTVHILILTFSFDTTVSHQIYLFNTDSLGAYGMPSAELGI